MIINTILNNKIVWVFLMYIKISVPEEKGDNYKIIPPYT